MPPAPAADAVPETHETLTLAAGGSTVAIVPALGGKIASLHLGGREWLWTSPTLPRVAPTPEQAADDAVSYVHVADTGGYDECLPTVGACTLPADVPGGLAGRALPDHGECWSQHAPTERITLPDGTAALVTTWRGRRMPYLLRRTVSVERDGTVRMAYELVAQGEAPMPFLWSSHPLLALTPDTRLDLPVAAPVRVWAEEHVDLGGQGATHRWPMLRVRARGTAGAETVPPAPGSPPGTGREVDFTWPTRVADAYACKLFLALPQPKDGLVRLGVEQADARLEVALDTREVPHLGLWINHGGWTPFAGGTPYRNLGFEPCIGMGDALDVALRAPWQSAAWLAPGETRRWSLAWRARPRPVV